MNYFELFDIPPSLKLEPGLLSKKFFELSRKFHPDFYTSSSTEEQSAALDKAANLNLAWKTLNDPDELIRYVLFQKALIEEEEKYALPGDFLSEVMDINEQMMDAEDATGRQEITSSLNIMYDKIYEPVKKTIEHYDEALASQEELLQVKEYYYKKKYLDRIRQQLPGKA